MFFTLNTAFINYLHHFPNLTEYHEFPSIRNKTTFEQILPISLNISKFDPPLLTASSNFKEFSYWYTNNKEILNCKKGMIAQNCILTKLSFLKIIL